jgi:hypothetical protein
MNLKFLLKVTFLIAFYVKLSQELYATNIIYISSSIEKIYSQNKSAVILVSNPEYLINLFKKIKVWNEFPTALNFLIYCTNFEIKILNMFSYHEFLTNALVSRSYFIEDNPNSLSLLTANAFAENRCKEIRFETVDILDKTTLIWKNQLRIEKKFENFYGCMLVLIYYATYINIEFGLTSDNKVFGFQFDFFDLMARRGNFVTFFQVKYNEYDGPANVPNVTIPDIFPYSNFDFEPDIYLTVDTHHGTNYHTTTTFDENVLGFAITPSEAYNSYEKMILPFDEMTWTYLIITFSCAFLFIFFMNYASKNIRSLIYGEDVNTPAFNVVAIFFGIGQTRLPLENFSRIILIIFIIFCLIIRTAYQGVQYDMLTKDMRKPLPKTIADLVDMGYVILYADLSWTQNTLDGLSNTERSVYFYVEITRDYQKPKKIPVVL